MNKILIVAPNWVGDSLFILPAVSALRASHPAAEMVLLASPALCGLHAANPVFDRRVAISRRSYLGAFSFQWGLRKEKFDLAVVFPDSFSSALGVFLTGARRRIGRAKEGRNFLLSQALAIPGNAGQRHVSLEYLDLAQGAGSGRPSAALPRLPLTAAGRSEQEELFSAAGLKAGKLIGLCPTSAFGPSKVWPAKHWAVLAVKLSGKGLRPVLLGAPWEKPALEEIKNASGLPLPILTPGLPGLAACLSRMKAVVANDSGPLHVAAAVGTPCVGLYGPVDPVWSAPLAARKLIFYEGLECSPCHAKVCPLGHHRCLEDMAPDRVARGILQWLPS